MRIVGIKLDNSTFTAAVAKIIRKYRDLPISQIKQLVQNNDYLYTCYVIRASGIKTIMQIREDLAKECITSSIFIDGKTVSDEYLNNLLISYEQTAEQVEAEMDREALSEQSE